MEYYLEAIGVSKHFGGIKALDAVDFKLKSGEVHCIVGENGAGKSTLGKMFVGINSVDEGTILVNGQEEKNITPVKAKKLKIAMVAQELNLMQHMSIAENIYMLEDSSYKKNAFYNRKKLIEKTKELFEDFDLDNFPPVTTTVSDLTVGQQQIVEIMKAVAQQNNILIFDEPTTALSLSEVDRLFKLIRRLKSEGVSIIIVTHRFDEIFAISDVVTVLCDGRLVASRLPIGELDKYKLIKLMVGRDVNDFYGQKQPRELGEEVLKVEGLSDGIKISDISFSLHKKEILGFAGLVGAGRTEIMETIFGKRKATQGAVYMNGKDILGYSTKKVIDEGIVLIPEDRKQKGIFVDLPIETNMAITSINKSKGFISYEKQYAGLVSSLVQKLKIKMDTPKSVANSLSGGNQQKVLLSKWLAMDAEIFIFDEPTKGIDVGTKIEIYNLIRELATAGKSIIVVSSEMQEVISICDRIIVVNDGKVVCEMSSDDATEQGILQYAITDKTEGVE